MKLLMATDGSNRSAIALHSAYHLLKTTEARVDVVYVARGLPVSSSKAGFSQLREIYHRRILPETRRILDEAQNTLSAEGAADVHLISETGSPARVIGDLSANYDLTVIGAKGREDRSNGGGLGPVASAIVSHVSGAILVGREIRPDRGARILVALDGSAASVQALERLTSLFDLDSSEVTLMHVVEIPWLNIDSSEEGVAKTEHASGGPDVSEALILGELRADATRLIERGREQVLAGHPAVSTLVREGNPSAELLKEAEIGEYDLVVLGGTGVVDLKHKILGSVSTQVVWNAPCSVLVVNAAA
jgi:nucleotide-binding universal stress UspA family protein